jgi:hypothetical protein
MGITVKTIGTVPVDRNIARVELFTQAEDRDAWMIVLHFQDAPYDGNTRLDEPRFGTETVRASYGEIKDLPLPGGGKVSDLFGPIRSLGYALRQRQIDQAAAAANQ